MISVHSFVFLLCCGGKKKKKNHTDKKVSYEKPKEVQLAFQLKPRKIFSKSQKLDFYIGNRKLVKHGKLKERTWLTRAKIKRMFIIEVIKSCWWLHLNCHLEGLLFFNQKSFSIENQLVTSFFWLVGFSFVGVFVLPHSNFNSFVY